MNETLLYTLDPYIISILFKTKTDEDTLEVYSKLVTSVDLVIKNTIKEFLMENGFNEEQIQKVLTTEDVESIDNAIKPYMQNIILVKKIDSNSKQFIKLYYDQLLPNLSLEEKTKLENYLKDSEEVIGKKKELVIENVKALKMILEENGVQSFDELRAKFEGEELPTEDMPVASEQDLAPVDQDAVTTSGQSNPVEVQAANAEPESVQTLSDNTIVSESPVAPVNMQDPPQNLESLPVSNQEVVAQNTTDQPVQENVQEPTIMPAQVAEPQVGQINVAPIEEQQSVSVPDPLLSPTKATIIDDEQPQVNTTAENNVNAVNQLQNMGIDLNDVLQPQPPQS
ncbi:MAG TPA: hypothetical protein PKU95_00165 [Candidatus Dojkabacteria bacterium]|nr:hypothetical protein [Candidatus Dojkabacteria bacterium]